MILMCLTFFFFFFFFNDTATTEIYTLSLHDALPISDPLQPRGPLQLRRLDDLAWDVLETGEEDQHVEGVDPGQTHQRQGIEGRIRVRDPGAGEIVKPHCLQE